MTFVVRSVEGSDLLKPFVPRLVLQWLREFPGVRHMQVPGSLAFVDISGFTTLTERLAKSGKVGAEEMNDLLDVVFTELLTVAYADGAGLIKWGGDAVLLLFQGDDHAARAARAAHRMRRTMRRVGRVRTSVGQVVLRMSVGIHSGAFDFFLVGETHRELIVTGPDATRTALMEAIADAGEIAISESTAAHLPASSVGERKAEARLLAAEPRVRAEPAETEYEVADLDVPFCLPVGIREHLMDGSREPEHRSVVAAFVEFSGVDALLAREGPEVVADALEGCVRSVQEATVRHEVTFFETDINKDGGKIMLIAGAPRTTGADEDRMLLTVRRIMEVSRDLSLRIGVNAGHVFAGDFGPSFRRSYSVKGDAINLAARLMAKAGSGQILATPRVLDRSRLAFETTALEPFTVKGKAKPVEAFVVGVQRSGRAYEADRRLPLVGREREMGVVRRALGSSLAGRGELVELVADPGLGKSRLVDEARTEAKGFRVLAAACEAYESSTPYFALRSLVRSAVGLHEGILGPEAADLLAARVAAIAPELAAWVPLLGPVLDVSIPDTPETAALEDEFRKLRLEDLVAELLGNILDTPTLLVIEDAHWIDDASADMLRRLARDVPARPWLLLLTRRDDGAGFIAPEGPRTTSIALEPLPAEATSELVGAATEESPLAPHEIAVLTERSGGNPLFLRELLSAAQSAGSVAGLPETVEAVIAAQIDRLPPRERSLLRHAAVLGQRFAQGLADEVIAEEVGELADDPWNRLSSFLVRGEDETLQFAHALIRDAAYAGLPFRRRRRLHARVGETIERTAPDPADQAEILSYHFFLSDAFEKAWHYSRLAGERARAIYANAESARFFSRALEASRKIQAAPEAVAEALCALGEVRERLGKYREASAAYRSARKLLVEDPIREAGIMLREAWIREASGRFSDAVRWHRRGLKLLEALVGREASAARAEHLVGIASMRHAQGRFKESIAWCHRAIAEAELAGERRVVAHAAYLLDWLHDEVGRPLDAPYPGLALRIYEELDDPMGQANVLNNLGMFAYFRGEWSEAIDLYERSRAARLRVGDEVNAAYGTANAAEILADQGRFDEAEARFSEALRVWRAVGYRQGIAFAVGNLGKIAACTGRADEARRLLGEARAAFEDVGFTGYVLEMDARIAECLALQGDGSAALEVAEEALRRSEAVGGRPALEVSLHRTRAYSLMQAGRLEDARRAVEDSLRLARAREAPFEAALSIEALSRLLRLEGLEPDEAAEAERAEILARLGVERTPEIPLPAEAKASVPTPAT